MPISSLVWIGVQLAQEAKFASGSSSRSFMDRSVPGTRIVGDLPCRDRLETSYDYVGARGQEKPISSRDGMKLCVETSTTFDDWVRQSEKDYQDMLVYLKENDFAKVGELTEKNA